MSNEAKNNVAKEAFSRRDFLHNSAAALTGAVFYSRVTTLAADEQPMWVAQEDGTIVAAEEVRSDSAQGLTLTSSRYDTHRGIDFKTGGTGSWSTRMRITKDGKVGIGSLYPTASLEIKNIWADWLFLRQERDVDGGGGFHIHNPYGHASQSAGDPSRNRLEIAYQSSDGTNHWGQFVLHGPTGRVGIGTATPGNKPIDGKFPLLDVRGYASLQGLRIGLDGYNDILSEADSGLTITCAANDPRTKIDFKTGGNSGSNIRMRITNDGDVGIGTRAPNAKLHVDGDIMARDVKLLNADVAEEFSTVEPEVVEPGSVMVLDGGIALRECTEAYDTKAVGVVSGAGDYKPALLLDRQTDQCGRLPVALMGKVFCKVDATEAAIKIGDLLTTSATKGHAMKAADRNRALGAIIGKALGALDSGTGLIPILVTLQ